MPGLDWAKFDSLPGSKSQNFEDLCRALVHLHYGQYGQFSALKNQPGVEFHLKLDKSCSLGDAPHWFGWQSKIHNRTSSGDLNAAGRKDIEDSLAKTKKHLPDLTDWVLWTPYTLSKKDQEWFYSVDDSIKLHLWTEKEIDTYLSGPGLMLRSTYFGDLVITPEELNQRHRQSIQPIRDRWLDPVHQATAGERNIRRMLGEPDSWSEMANIGESLRQNASKIADATEDCPHGLQAAVRSFVSACSSFADTLIALHQVLSEDLGTIREKLRKRDTLIDLEVHSMPRQLRTLNHPAALVATNALDDMRIAKDLLAEVEDFIGVGLVAFVADAGGGKTQLAAQLTSAQNSRPCGVLLHGRDLHKGQSLDNLAGRFIIQGNSLPTFEKLLAALDAAGKRAKCRLPIVIDGLNEAENPKDWKASLASLSELVDSYPNVLVVCTLRTGERRREDLRNAGSSSSTRESFAVMALPENIRRIDGEGFGGDVDSAIEKYFQYFRISYGEAEIPTELFQHPLTLRIFCQVTNPTRKDDISITYFPASLSSLFEKYLANACERIASMVNLTHQYSSEEVGTIIYQLGLNFWDVRKRNIDEGSFRQLVGDSGRNWDSSAINLLVQEGIIFRNPGETPGKYEVAFIYDALGGFVIANSLLTKNAQDARFAWLQETSLIDAFTGDEPHELAADIFKAIVVQTPRKMNGTQLWKFAPNGLRGSALRFCMELDSEFIDQDTVTELLNLFEANPKKIGMLYQRLRATRAVTSHPLNANLLDAILRKKSVADRDLSWTEWLRSTRSRIFDDLVAIENRWKDHSERTPSDTLRIKWVMWLLTSTDHELRDIATRAIYWFGRQDPQALFDETIRSLEINDPYVPERMLAASYGVAMALHSQSGDLVKSSLCKYAKRLYDSLFSKGAKFGTTHALMREYVSNTIELSSLYDHNLLSTEELSRTKHPFAGIESRKWGESKIAAEEISGRDSPFRMDFENYTLGRLVPERRNYDFNHEEYRKVRAQVLWRVEELGWTPRLFEQIDEGIGSYHQHRRTGGEEHKTDRYGKKYSLIAFFERLGLAFDQGRTSDWENLRWSMDIDPSFPEPAAEVKIIDDSLLGDPQISRQEWVANDTPPDFAPYFRIAEIGGNIGPWVMLDCYVTQEDKILQRGIFSFIRSFLVRSNTASAFLARLSQQDLGGRWLPEKVEVSDLFAGEIPWCSKFANSGPVEFSFIKSEETVKVKRKIKEYYLDGKKLTNSDFTSILMGMTKSAKHLRLTAEEIKRIEVRTSVIHEDKVIQKHTKFKVLDPVCDFSSTFKTASSTPCHGAILAKEVATQMNLRAGPQTLDLFTNDGERATLNISRGEDFRNKESMFFIKENLLKNYLKENKLSLIWAIWGEREHLSTTSDEPAGFSIVQKYDKK